MLRAVVRLKSAGWWITATAPLAMAEAPLSQSLWRVDRPCCSRDRRHACSGMGILKSYASPNAKGHRGRCNSRAGSTKSTLQSLH